MKTLILLLCYVAISAYAMHSAQQERCEILHSVANTDNQGTLVQCSVGQSCFSLDCIPSIGTDSEFHISIEPCKHPVAILVNASVSGHQYSHEFTHSETVDIPYTSVLGTLQLAVVLDNTDNKTLVFSVLVIAPGIQNFTIVPETRFPLDNITCVNGHLLTSATTPHYTTKGHTAYSCMETCVAIHNMVSKTKNLCQSTADCLTINCNSPSTVSILDLTSSYKIEPCHSPPAILVKFDDNNNNIHYSRNITHDTTYTPPLHLPFGNPTVQMTMERPDNYSILFGVNLIVLTQTIQILPQQRIPIDRSGCPGYTGPTVNPYCTTQATTSANTATTHPSSHTISNTNSVTQPNTPVIHSVTPSVNQTTAAQSNAGKIAGIIIGVILVNIAIVGVAVLVTVGVVYSLFKRKSKGVYAYSQFQALEEDD